MSTTEHARADSLIDQAAWKRLLTLRMNTGRENLDDSHASMLAPSVRAWLGNVSDYPPQWVEAARRGVVCLPLGAI